VVPAADLDGTLVALLLTPPRAVLLQSPLRPMHLLRSTSGRGDRKDHGRDLRRLASIPLPSRQRLVTRAAITFQLRPWAERLMQVGRRYARPRPWARGIGVTQRALDRPLGVSRVDPSNSVPRFDRAAGAHA
jgi:hypothetical protein